MCIVIAKRKGAKYDLDTAIQMCINGFNNNNQGCGLARLRKKRGSSQECHPSSKSGG